VVALARDFPPSCEGYDDDEVLPGRGGAAMEFWMSVCCWCCRAANRAAARLVPPGDVPES
jgi:hypothetical protein